MMNWLQKVSTGFYNYHIGYNGYWVDSNGKIYKLEDTHHSWIYNNKKLLRANYDIDLDGWIMEEIERSGNELYEQLKDQLISDRAFEQDIDESQITLTESDEQDLYDSAEGDSPDGLEMVDYLIHQGWIRVSQKNAVIHFETAFNNESDWDRLETILIKLFPEVWSNGSYHIIVNNDEIFSEDLQQEGNLRGAITKLTRRQRSPWSVR